MRHLLIQGTWAVSAPTTFAYAILVVTAVNFVVFAFTIVTGLSITTEFIPARFEVFIVGHFAPHFS
jgi:hypothetical protein